MLICKVLRVGPETYIHKLTSYTTEYRTQKLMYIKLPMHLFFYVALGLHDFDVGKSITWVIGRDCSSK